MAPPKQRQTKRDRRPDRGRRKSCPYCLEKIDRVDYKDITRLRRFVSERGKIRTRRVTGACRKHQSQIAKAVKLSRELALLPYVGERGAGGRDRD